MRNKCTSKDPASEPAGMHFDAWFHKEYLGLRREWKKNGKQMNNQYTAS